MCVSLRVCVGSYICVCLVPFFFSFYLLFLTLFFPSSLPPFILVPFTPFMPPQLPPPSERRRPAVYLDVMEIQYVCQLLSDSAPVPVPAQSALSNALSGTNTPSINNNNTPSNANNVNANNNPSSKSNPSSSNSNSNSNRTKAPRIVDSSAERAPPGTSAQSIYYILGQQNGPPGRFPPGWDLTLRGMVAGEKRRITLPYTLALDRRGDKDRGIPPFATLVYTVKLKSLT